MSKTKVWVKAQVSLCIGEVDTDTYVEYLDKAKALWKKKGHPTVKDAFKYEMNFQPTEIDQMDGWVWEGLKTRKQRENDDNTEKGS